MFRSEKTLRYRHKRDNPSFSSSLLDQICRSIDHNDGNGIADTKNENMKFNRETMQKKSSMEKRVFEQATNVEKKEVFKEFKRKSHSHHDVRFFSSTSSSSDSSSGGFSSSDTESIMYGTKTKAPCSVPKPVRTSVSARPGKPLFTEQRNLPTTKINGDSKKVKQQPISPGARLASFISSLFTTTGTNSNTKKTKSPSSVLRYDDEVSTACSSATSFSRSCLSKNSPSTREKSRDGIKRTVRFGSVDEDSKPCVPASRLLPVSFPAAWKIGKPPSRKCEEDVKFQVMEKSKRVEEIAREFLKGYHQNQKNSRHYELAKMDEDDYDDAASDSSSDLFELDHLVLKGNDRYREELPVYETTHVQTNRAIANGFIV